MAAARTSTTFWVILGVVASIFFGMSSFVWSILQGQISELRADLTKAKEDARWSYATKDYVNGKIDGIREEETTYRKYVK